MGCDVCISSSYDFDGNPDFQYVSTPRARKDHHVCCECRQRITKGEQYERYSWKFEGTIGTTKTCHLCAEIRDAFYCDGGGVAEELWHDMHEYVFPVLTMSSECFVKLSAVAKSRVIEKWQKWKGLRK